MFMRKFWLAASFAAFAATPAFAVDDSIMATRFGNTEHVENSIGHASIYFNADHTFTGKASAVLINLSLKGTWKIDGTNLCLTYDSPPPGEDNPSCAPATAHVIGDTWDSKGRKVTLLKGIVD
jgi:hypothetical protein